MPTSLVTGAGSGIGRAISLRLANEGHLVLATDVSLEAATETSVLGQPGSVQPFGLDVADPGSVNEFFRQWSDLPLDNLINNAGIGVAGSVSETSHDEWNRVMAVNAGGTFSMCRAVVPRFVENGGGVIVNIASIAGLIGLKNRAVYCASKAAIIGLTRSIAVDYAEAGIRCNAVAPGTVESPWIEKIIAGAPDPEAQRAAMARRQLDGVMGTPEEVAGAVAFLLGPSGRFANGSVLVLDGGVTAA